MRYFVILRRLSAMPAEARADGTLTILPVDTNCLHSVTKRRPALEGCTIASPVADAPQRALGRFARQIAVPKTVKRFPPDLWIFLCKTWIEGGRIVAALGIPNLMPKI